MKNLMQFTLNQRTKWTLAFLTVMSGEVFSQVNGRETQTFLDSLLKWFIPLAAIYINFRIIVAIVKVVKKLTDDEETNSKNAAYRQLAMLVGAVILINGFWIVMSDWGMDISDALDNK